LDKPRAAQKLASGGAGPVLKAHDNKTKALALIGERIPEEAKHRAAEAPS
jgi:hypothetical protein